MKIPLYFGPQLVGYAEVADPVREQPQVDVFELLRENTTLRDKLTFTEKTRDQARKVLDITTQEKREQVALVKRLRDENESLKATVSRQNEQIHADVGMLRETAHRLQDEGEELRRRLVEAGITP